MKRIKRLLVWIFSTLGSLSVLSVAFAIWRFSIWPWQPPRLPVVARASSAAPGYPPESVLQGRCAGFEPVGFKAEKNDADPYVELELRQPLSVSAVVVRLVRASRARAVLSLDGQQAKHLFRDSRRILWHFERPRTATRIRLATKAHVGEIQPVLGKPAFAIFEGERTADALLEIFRGFGIPVVVLPADVTSLRLVDRETRVVVTSEPHKAVFKEALLQHIKKGGLVLEAGPKSDLCDTPEQTGPWAPIRLRGRLAPESIRVVASLASKRVGVDSAEYEALIETHKGQPFLVHYGMGAGTCLRLMADFVEVLMRLRQGDPALSDSDSNHKMGIQPSDLFTGWIDPENFARPQADLLVEAIISSLALPYRFHLIPPNTRGVLLFTVDQDYVPDLGVTEQLKQTSKPFTVLLTDTQVGGKPDVDFGKYKVDMLSRETVDRIVGEGHEIGIHANLLGITKEEYGSVLAQHVARFRSAYGRRPRISRNHHVRWAGFTRMAEIEARLGIELNLDYMAHAFKHAGALGFLNGSGLPLRFLREDGTVLPIYQQSTQLDDHVMLPERFGFESLDLDGLSNLSRKLLEKSVQDPPHAITINHHSTWWFDTKGGWQRAIIEEAQRLSLAVMGAESWLDHVTAVRNTVVQPAGVRRIRVLTANTATALLLRGSVKARINDEPTQSSELRLAGIAHTRLSLDANSDLLVEW